MCEKNYRKPRRFYPIPPTSAKKAATKYDVDGDGCWISRYSVASHGYAQIGWCVNDVIDGKHIKHTATTAHRAAWVHHAGEQVPEGLTVDHICRKRACVNPDHLRLMSNMENASDPDRFGRQEPEPLSKHCAKGHQMFQYAQGEQHCRPCAAEWAARKKAGRGVNHDNVTVNA